MIGLVLHALWVSALLGLAALVADPLARAIRLPTRVVWAAGIVGSVVLMVWGVLSPPSAAESSTLFGVRVSQASETQEGATGGGDQRDVKRVATLSLLTSTASPRTFRDLWWERLAPMPTLALRAAQDRIAPTPELRERGERLFAMAWAGGSFLLLSLLGAGVVHHRRVRRRWPHLSVLGHTVRLTPHGGPAVAGFLKPEILLPHWVLALPERELALLLCHEDEHRKARDPLLLAGTSLLVALAPWNPLLWWQMHRLRDAIEVDCDARVLRRSRPHGLNQPPMPSPVRPYAELLLRVGSLTSSRPKPNRSALPPFVTMAMGGSSTQLARRFNAMRGHRPHPLVLSGALGAALLFVTAACVADNPTVLEPSNEGISTLEIGVSSAAPTDREAPTISIPAHVDPLGTVPREATVTPMNPQVSSGVAGVLQSGLLGAGSMGSPSPLIVIDGVIVDAASLDKAQINASDIASIEVMRGDAALERFGERARNGAILISTKRTTLDETLSEEIERIEALTIEEIKLRAAHALYRARSGGGR